MHIYIYFQIGHRWGEYAAMVNGKSDGHSVLNVQYVYQALNTYVRRTYNICMAVASPTTYPENAFHPYPYMRAGGCLLPQTSE